MKLVVFGANGPTGQLLTKQALAEGHAVTAVTRHPDQFPLQHAHLRVVSGNVFDLASVEGAVEGQDTVLSTLGVPFSNKPITVYSEGMAHIIQAMQRFGVRRVVCVSSSAADPQTRYHDSGGGFFFEKVMKPLIINTMGRTMYADMLAMETMVMNSGLDWTIIRPSGLFETAAVTPYKMAETSIRGQYTSRADLADCMLRQATSKQYLGKVLAVATVAEQPKMIQMIMKEAFQTRPQ
ncbi:MAG: SDR family oxidoreductase [Chloroflexota bacterium]